MSYSKFYIRLQLLNITLEYDFFLSIINFRGLRVCTYKLQDGLVYGTLIRDVDGLLRPVSHSPK